MARSKKKKTNKKRASRPKGRRAKTSAKSKKKTGKRKPVGRASKRRKSTKTKKKTTARARPTKAAKAKAKAAKTKAAKAKAAKAKAKAAKAKAAKAKAKAAKARAAKAKAAKAKAAKAKAAKAKAAKAKAAKAKAAKLKAAKAKAAKLKAAKAKAAKLKAAKAKERKERERERAQAAKERERARREKERERERRAKEREKARLAKERERQRAQAAREKERERKRKEKERARIKAEKEKERARIKAEKAKAREAAKKAREEERARIRAEKEAERERIREENRRIKEEERKRREAEREAYRKAKEAERAKIRAEKEAQRRALEGRVARSSVRQQRGMGPRGATTARVYSPASIPNQSGTRKLIGGMVIMEESKFANLQNPPVAPRATSEPSGLPTAAYRPPTVRPPPAPKPDRIEDRFSLIGQRLAKTGDQFQREYRESFDMSWIYHDSALEGVVYTFQELKTAIDPNITVVPDSSLQPVCEEIRRHKAAIDLVRDLSEKKRVPINLDLIKKLYLTLHPDDGDLKSLKYRKDIPQHRLYFHEYSAPDKIAYRVRQVVDWLNGPEPKKLKNPLRVAARAHYDFLRVFPFAQDSGKVARLMMNLILMRSGYPPAIIHSTERQKYYEALKGSLPTIIQMANEAIINGLQSIEKRLDEEESRTRGFAT